MSSDEAIQLTNNDASSFKAYAVSKGYWSDPYIHFFSSASGPGLRQQEHQQQTHFQQPLVEHKPPEMSRGYFARVNAIRSAVFNFLDKCLNSMNPEQAKCQIINLGSGYDTLYFNLLDKNMLPTKYIEIDFPRIVMSKIRLIRSKKALSDKIIRSNKPEESKIEQVQAPTQIEEFKTPFLQPSLPVHAGLQSNSEIHTDNYDLVSADLRNIKELDKKLKECNIDFSLPTLVVAECVLVYMTCEHSSNLLKYLAESFKECCFVNYEQVNLNDKFGEIMLANMELRACRLLGIEGCGSIENQFKRFAESGFDPANCQILTMSDFYRNKLYRSERDRIESIEFLDESELLFQLMDHYCICIAANSPQFKQVFFN